MLDLVLDLETIAGDHGRAALPALAAARAAKRVPTLADVNVASLGFPVGLFSTVDPEAFGALCPPLCQVVVIAFLAPKGNGEPEDRENAAYDTIKLPGKIDTPGESEVGERALLKRANQIIGHAGRLITFNGRHFDLPVLIHRMIAHGLTPAPLLVDAFREHRYRPNLHVDVLDVMTGHGAAERHSLAAYAIGHGLRDAKEKRTDGAEVAELVRRGETTKVVRHALEDVQETAALYRRWAPILEGARERLEA